MTGAYVRVQREEQWVNVEIEHLTDEELRDYIKRHPDDGWLWAKFLIRFINPLK